MSAQVIAHAPVPHGGRHVTAQDQRPHDGRRRPRCSCGWRDVWQDPEAAAGAVERHELDHVE